MSGRADDQFRGDPPRLSRRQVVLPEMHAVSADGQRDVKTVIDDQERPGGIGERLDLSREARHVPSRQPLLAKLDKTNPAAQRCPHDVRRAAPAAQFG